MQYFFTGNGVTWHKHTIFSYFRLKICNFIF